jgi:hypothetical protein
MASAMAVLRRSGTRLLSKSGTKLFTLTSRLTMDILGSSVAPKPVRPMPVRAKPMRKAPRQVKARTPKPIAFNPNPGGLDLFFHVPHLGPQQCAAGGPATWVRPES